MFEIPDFREWAYKIAFCAGILIVLYGVLWLLVSLKIIPAVVIAVFPPIVLIVIGAFIIYTAYQQKNRYY